MKIVVASGNEKKLAELRRLAEGLPVEVLSPKEAGGALPEVVEDGETFEANAEKKARAFARAYGIPALADDSGICVDALGGAPGVKSARYSGDEAAADRDERNNQKLLAALAGLAEAQRSARFLCALTLAHPDGRAHTVVGSWEGIIAFSPRGGGGFGYDPLFLIPHRGKTSAELEPEEKGRLSHRGAAMRAMRAHLEEGLAAQ